MTAELDVLIRGATVIDGTGAPRFSADLGIKGKRIDRIGDLRLLAAKQVIDAAGLVVAPGFIDSHTHDDRVLLSAGEMTPKVSQGVTTVIAGNCGISLAPMPVAVRRPVTPPLDLLDDSGEWYRYRCFADYLAALEQQPAVTNCVLLIGHTTLRAVTMHDLGQPATAAQIEAMREHVVEALEAGAVGVSTGLAYPPAQAATQQEVIDICAPLARYGGFYATHIRDEGDDSIASLDEAFAIGRAVGAKVIISHHKLTGERNFGRSSETLQHFSNHMKYQEIGLDCYPYTASSTILEAETAKDASRTLVSWSRSLPQYAGYDLQTVMMKMGCTLDEAVERLQPAGGVYFRMHEDDVQRILGFERTMIGSDGLPHDEQPHPRLWGTFPRVLGRYSRELALFPLEQAVHKMTGLTAKEFGLIDRGVVREGAFGDLTLFDPNTVNDQATFEEPIAVSRGIDSVFVNGILVWRDGKATGERPGQVLRRGKA